MKIVQNEAKDCKVYGEFQKSLWFSNDIVHVMIIISSISGIPQRLPNRWQYGKHSII